MEPISIYPEDIVAYTEIGEMLGVSRSCVSNWTRRYEDFPKPIRVLACGKLYSAPEILAWARRRGHLKDAQVDILKTIQETIGHGNLQKFLTSDVLFLPNSKISLMEKDGVVNAMTYQRTALPSMDMENALKFVQADKEEKLRVSPTGTCVYYLGEW